MLDRFLNMPINTAAKRLSTEKHWNKTVHWYGISYASSKYSLLHFFLEWQFSLFDFLSMKTFFHSGRHSVLQLSKINVDCVLLTCTLNRISVLIEMFSIYLTTVITQWFFTYQNSLPVLLGNYRVMRKRTGRKLL